MPDKLYTLCTLFPALSSMSTPMPLPAYPGTTAPPSSTTETIVAALSLAIVERRLAPGSKLTEQKLAQQFAVSRTLVRQALFQLAQRRLVKLEPARGAFVAAPSVHEARDVFAVRRMLEAGLVQAFVRQKTAAQIRLLRQHVAREQIALQGQDLFGQTELLGDFHVRLAELMGNQVLAQMLTDLVTRCALITMLYQSHHAACHSHEEHAEIVNALAAGDAARAEQLMQDHLKHVEEGLELDRAMT
jgi:DNA-binding GntR family transcriptional regulator